MRRFHKCVIEYFDDEYSRDIDIDEINSNFKESSYDDDNDISLIESEEECINFDELTKLYFERHNNLHKFLNSKKYPKSHFTEMHQYKSNDAIWSYGGIQYFIEFKNTSKPNGKEIYSKIKDSLLIYLEIMDESISVSKEKLGYILVYNPDSYDKIQSTVKSFANQKIDKFGLRANLEDFYFKKVMTLSKEEFENLIK